MIPMKGNLRVAHAVLATLQAFLPSDRETFDAWIECFDNCREQGLVIKHYANGQCLNIAFCEQASSDDIVVYTYVDTAYPSNLPKDWGKAKTKYFRYREISEAALYILGILRERTPSKENAA